jgi:putative DNA primase/helicase
MATRLQAALQELATEAAMPPLAMTDEPGRAMDADPRRDVIKLSPGDDAPLALARLFLREVEADAAGRCTLARWGEDWWRFRRDHGWYRQVTEEAVRAEMYPLFDRVRKFVQTEDGPRHVPLRPNKALVSNVIDALMSMGVARRPSEEPPCWLDGEVHFDPQDVLVCPNAIVHLPSGQRMDPTPDFFTLGGVVTRFDPDAGTPVEWMKFLSSLWPDDPESIVTLQMVMGYLLTPDTRQQKIFLFVGPKRSGKGTIARIIRALVGKANLAGPSLTSLQSDFGLSPLLGKLVGIVSDARLGPKADQAAIAERLLSISGEDAIDVNRKHRDILTVRLPTRLVVLSNEIPRLTDASGALASRFIVLTTRLSFFGREDKHLEQRLLPELPAILQWAIEGWHLLRDRGAFVQPASAGEDVRALEELASPTLSFVDDCCVVDAALESDVADLFQRWQRWCDQNGRQTAGTIQNFSRDLRAAVPEIDLQRQRRPDGSRRRIYSGLGLR